MFDFWIGTAATHVGLDGAGRHETIQGAHRLYKSSQADVIEELLTLELNDKTAGTATIESCLDELNTILDLARQYAREGIGEPIYLHLEPVEDDVWESPVIDGWIDYTGSGEPVNDHLRGSMGVTIHLWRRNWFEGAEVQLNTYGVLGLNSLNGTVISDQFAYTNESNFMYIELNSYPQGLTVPSPARLEMVGLTTGGTIGELIVSHAYNGTVLGYDFFLSDAAGTGGTAGSDATCCGGTYRTLSWTDLAETTLETWDLSAAFCAQAGGKYFKPVIRFGADVAYTDLQLKLQIKVTSTDTVLGESGWSPCSESKRIQEIATLRLPPFKLADPSNAAGLSIALVARRNTAGSHSFRLDYLQLLPIDGWRKYDPIYPLPKDWTLIDNGPLGIVTAKDASGAETITHAARGEPFMIAPNLRNVFYFVWMNASGGAVIHDQMNVKVWARPRKRF